MSPSWFLVTVCSRDGEKIGEEGELGRVTVTSLELKVWLRFPLSQACWTSTLLKDVHTFHYVLFYETFEFLGNTEILNLAKYGWPFPGNCSAGVPPGGTESSAGVSSASCKMEPAGHPAYWDGLHPPQSRALQTRQQGSGSSLADETNAWVGGFLFSFNYRMGFGRKKT